MNSAHPQPVAAPQRSPSEKLRQTVTVLRQILGEPQPQPTSLPAGLSTSSSSSSLQSLESVSLDAAHWLEVADSRHRYGSALRPYYEAWIAQGERDRGASTDNFFRFLDGPDGRDLDLVQHENCAPCCRYRPRDDVPPPRKRPVSRKVLEESILDYCNAERRRQYVVAVRDGALVWAVDGEHWAAGDVVHTGTCDKYIFVMGLDGSLYVNRKVKGRFHHSCFLAGGRVRAAGRIVVLDGRVVFVAAQSGHYKPDPRCVEVVLCVLAASGMDVRDVRVTDSVVEDCPIELTGEACVY
jgi:hypothetical protein